MVYVAAGGREVTEEEIAGWEAALERDEWPEGWANVGGILEGDALRDLMSRPGPADCGPVAGDRP